ncbi:MAG: TetR/AcrR family transcriptional regulator [Pseudomonadales bacterium]|nr:TetR/AcrR family transcriptional regulator [Pseudomonadales bacterium]
MTDTPRRPGRRAGAEGTTDSREALLQAASELFASRGADAVSVRQVADSAGVSAAMINYHFKDKRGLMRAVLERGLDRLLEIITEVAGDHDGPVTTSFINRYIHALNEDPALPQLMVREVLARNSPYQKVIAERFARKAVNLMPARLMEDIAESRLRGDLDPTMTMMSLVGMCVFPFLAGPILWPVLGYEYDEEFANRLVAHTTRLFNEGATPKDD